MKKITALLMVVIMVAAMIPAMALATSAAATEIKLGKYGSGAESWSGDPVYGNITHFLITLDDEKVFAKDMLGAIGYVGAHKEKDEEAGTETVVPATAEGYFTLTITDRDGKTGTVKKMIPNTVYNSGAEKKDLVIMRFNTNEYGYNIQQNNIYKVKVDVCSKDGKVLYTGTMEGLEWGAGSSEAGKKIWKEGKEIKSEYDVSAKYPVKGVEFLRYAGTDDDGMLVSDWEEHDSWKHALIVMIPKDKLVSAADVGAGIQAKIDLGNGKKLTATNNSTYGFDEAILLRLECDKVPAAGELYHATIELYDTEGKTLKYVGTCDVSNGGVKDPEAYELDPKNYPVTSALTPYASGEDVTSHWEVWGGENGTLCLIVVIDNVVNDKDFSIGKVTATFDGKEVKDCLNSTAGLGEGKTVLRLELGKPSEGEHKVSVSVATDDLVLYETDEITVKYNAKGTQTTGGKTEPTSPEKPSGGKTSDKTGDGVVVATVAMAIALAAMAVVVKKIKA